jgi:hypothetical protein
MRTIVHLSLSLSLSLCACVCVFVRVLVRVFVFLAISAEQHFYCNRNTLTGRVRCTERDAGKITRNTHAHMHVRNAHMEIILHNETKQTEPA